MTRRVVTAAAALFSAALASVAAIAANAAIVLIAANVANAAIVLIAANVANAAIAPIAATAAKQFAAVGHAVGFLRVSLRRSLSQRWILDKAKAAAGWSTATSSAEIWDTPAY